MKYNFCTLFDSGFLDRGLSLYKSLDKNMGDFTLYIYAFDKKAYDILVDLNLNKAVVLYIDDIETEQMKAVRMERSRAEYCWTCTPIIIEYSLEIFGLDNCTYIDADTYFYANPACLIEEMKSANCDVLITKHGFPNNREGKITEKKSGKYCVQFNTFLNTLEARKVLSWWKEQCLLCCTSTPIDGKFGDQKYLENWVEDFPRVYESTNFGAGVANWNIVRFKMKSMEANHVMITDCETQEDKALIFYHFHGLKEISGNRIDINVYRNRGKIDDRLVQYIYKTYFAEFTEVRRFLGERYGIEYPMIRQEVKKKNAEPKIKEAKCLEERWYEIIRMVKARFYRKKDIFSI